MELARRGPTDPRRERLGETGLSTLIEQPENVRKRKKRKVDRGFQGGARGEGLHFFFCQARSPEA
jgi:hypothetical protein